MGGGWQEVADRVLVRETGVWQVNVGLVLGDSGCLVIDTGASYDEGRELADAVRSVTRATCTVVNTHAHVDHVLGNAAFGPARFWGHRRCGPFLDRPVEQQWERIGVTPTRAQVEGARVVAPDQLVDDQAVVRIGDRAVTLTHLGRGHTDNDLVVTVPDVGVLFAGDLVREGGTPWVGDGFPLEWPDALRRLEGLAVGAVVPGHGRVIGRTEVAEHRVLFEAVAQVARTSYRAGFSVEAVARELPLPPRAAGHAATRAYGQLDGSL
jgi:glyoxylase-like metal-dependent hydrolase (beta-lactamase superfamily II)